MSTLILMLALAPWHAGEAVNIDAAFEEIRLAPGPSTTTPEATIRLDSEPLGSGDCHADLAMYRRHLDMEHRLRLELEKPDWAFTLPIAGLAFILGTLVGAYTQRRPKSPPASG